MSDSGHCKECAAIAEEMRAALRDLSPAPPPTRPSGEAQEAMRRMLDGAEELESHEILGEFKFRDLRWGIVGTRGVSPKMHDLARRALEHLKRTGHSPSPRR